MKVITWNCNSNFSKKVELLRSESADILIIQECEKLPNDFLFGHQFFWCGQNENRGLGILIRSSEEAKQIETANKFAYVLPIQSEFGLIMGVWSFNSRARKFGPNITGYIADALDFLGPLISQSPKAIVAGDFNNALRWDRRVFHRNNFRFIHNQLKARGFGSSYHTFFGETVGRESNFTHFHQRNLGKKFHIDYVYQKGSRVTDVRLGAPEVWIKHSDHVPMIVKLSQ